MDAFLDWAAEDGARWLGDVVIPVFAILVPTLIAVRLAKRERTESRLAARSERDDAADKDERSRRLEAGKDVIVALAGMVSFDPLHENVRPILSEIRARIAVYRAWSPDPDVSGDWLVLKSNEGNLLWARVFAQIDEASQSIAPGYEPGADWVFSVAHEAHAWASETVDTFSRWLRGDISDQALLEEGQALIGKYGLPNAPNGAANETPARGEG